MVEALHLPVGANHPDKQIWCLGSDQLRIESADLLESCGSQNKRGAAANRIGGQEIGDAEAPSFRFRNAWDYQAIGSHVLYSAEDCAQGEISPQGGYKSVEKLSRPDIVMI